MNSEYETVLANPSRRTVRSSSFFKRLFGTVIFPSSTFDEIARVPKPVTPLIIIVLTFVAPGAVIYGKFGAEGFLRIVLQRNGQAATATPKGDELILRHPKLVMASAVAGGAVALPLIMLLEAGLGIWIISSISGMKLKMTPAYSVVCYASLVQVIIRSIVTTPVLVFGDLDHLNLRNLSPTNVAFFIDPNEISRSAYSVAQTLDATTIWHVALLGIGFSRLTGGKVHPLSVFVRFMGIWLAWSLMMAGRG